MNVTARILTLNSRMNFPGNQLSMGGPGAHFVATTANIGQSDAKITLAVSTNGLENRGTIGYEAVDIALNATTGLIASDLFGTISMRNGLLTNSGDFWC